MALNLFGFIIYRCKYTKNSVKNNDRKNKIFSIFAFILTFLIMGLRADTVGTDTRSYNVIFQTISHSENITETPGFSSYPIYNIYNKMLSFISKNTQILNIINAFLTVGIVAFLIYKISYNIFMSWFLYISLSYYIWAFNTSRQYLAMSVMYLGLYFFRSNKKIIGIIIMLTAVFIHNTVFVVFLILLLSFVKYNKTILLNFMVFIPVIMTLYNKIINLFIILFPKYGGYLNMEMRNNIYINTGGGGRIFVGIFIMSIVFLAFYFDKILSIREDYQDLCLRTVVAIIAVWYMIIFHKYSLMLRIEQIFSFSVIFYIPNIIQSCFKKRSNRNIIFLGLAVVTLIPYLKNLSDFLPYKFFWSNI